jgi:hypothetical protein
MPGEAAVDIRGRMRDWRPEQFASAFFELYLHQLHLGLGFEVEIHPEVPGTNRRPDFRVSRNGQSHYLEAAVIGPPPSEAAPENRVSRITDAINRVRSSDFALHFEIEQHGQEAPAMRSIRREIEGWLATLNWEEIRALAAGGHINRLPYRRWRRDGWEFSVQAWPKSPEARGKAGNAIWAGPSGGGVYDDPGAVSNVLNRKAFAYGRPDRPLVLALYLDRMTTHHSDVAAALFGPDHELRDFTDGAWRPGGEGLWRGPEGWRTRRVAGVLSWSVEFRPWSIARQKPARWQHPEQPDVDMLGPFEPSTVFELPEIESFEDSSHWPGRPFQERQ